MNTSCNPSYTLMASDNKDVGKSAVERNDFQSFTGMISFCSLLRVSGKLWPLSLRWYLENTTVWKLEKHVKHLLRPFREKSPYGSVTVNFLETLTKNFFLAWTSWPVHTFCIHEVAALFSILFFKPHKRKIPQD